MKNVFRMVIFAVLGIVGTASMAGGAIPMMTGQEPLPTPPNYTYNLGVETIDQRMFRMFHEMTKMPSSRVTSISIEDKKRIDALYDNLVNVITQVGVTGQTCTTDFAYLYEIDLTEIEGPFVDVENEAINSALKYLYGSNLAMRTSQSTRRNDCLDAPDAENLIAAVAKSREWVENFYLNSNPMDMPQSAPSQDIIEPASYPAAQ